MAFQHRSPKTYSPKLLQASQKPPKPPAPKTYSPKLLEASRNPPKPPAPSHFLIFSPALTSVVWLPAPGRVSFDSHGSGFGGGSYKGYYR